MESRPDVTTALPDPYHPTNTWTAETRRWIVVGLIVLAALFVYWIRETLPVLVLAALIAYLLNPLVKRLQQNLRMPRVVAVALIYLTFVALLVAGIARGIPMLFRELSAFISDLDSILAQADAAVTQIPFLGALGISLDIGDRLRSEFLSLTAAAPGFVIGAASRIFSTIAILVLSFYLLKDAEMIGRGLDSAIPAGYQDEWARIKNELVRIWSSFLRGQILLAIIIGAVTTTVLALLGVRNALLLGLLAGVLEVVPTIGPIIAAVPAVLIAWSQGSAHWAIDNATFAIIVSVAYVLIQQLENHLIVPNVLGSSVNLPPVVILFGALAGTSVAGILGIFLAAPVLATLRLVAQFILRKLFEPL